MCSVVNEKQIRLNELYRPSKFKDVVGQEKVKKALKNSIVKNSIQNAYLLEGQTGGGKTTTARIFLKALNCQNPIDNEPCGECVVCKESTKNPELVDIIEIDGGENRGIDKIRELKDLIKYSPKYNYRGVIIDEVHMLTREGATALLKVLEEPPERTIFIIITNEPEKIMKTIKDRCTRLIFKKIAPSLIKDRLGQIAKENNINIDDKALTAISVICDGSLREALTIFQQVAIISADSKITIEDLKDIVNVEQEYIKEMIYNILSQDIVKIMECIDIEEASISSSDFDYFISRFRRYLYSDGINLKVSKLVSQLSNVFVGYKNKLTYNISSKTLIELACIDSANVVECDKESRQWMLEHFDLQDEDSLSLAFKKAKLLDSVNDVQELDSNNNQVTKDKRELFMSLMSIKFRDFEYKFNNCKLEIDNENVLCFIVENQDKKSELTGFLKREYAQSLKPICDIEGFIVRVRSQN